MVNNFKELCDLYPQFKKLQPLTIDKYSCDKDGFTSVFFNEYSILKFRIDVILDELKIKNENDSSFYKTITINHFMKVASDKWNDCLNNGFFEEELSESDREYKVELHNNHIKMLYQLQKLYY